MLRAQRYGPVEEWPRREVAGVSHQPYTGVLIPKWSNGSQDVPRVKSATAPGVKCSVVEIDFFHPQVRDARTPRISPLGTPL